MTKDSSLDFSLRDIPDEWQDAALEAPELSKEPRRRSRMLRVIPTSEKADLMTGSIAAIAMSVVSGVGWFALETRDHLETPWTAVVVGVLIAIGVRLGSGRADPELRATLSFVFYMLTLFATIYMIERYDFVLTYGESPDLEAANNVLLRDRLSHPMTVLAWIIGLLSTMQVSYLTGFRRKRLTL